MKKRTIKVLLMVCFVILGIGVSRFGFTTELGHPTSTICFLFGLFLALLAFIFLIKEASSNN
jgi:hypothetical protein